MKEALKILFSTIIYLITKFLQIQIKFFKNNYNKLIEKLKFKIDRTYKIWEDTLLKFNEFNETFKKIQIFKFKTILFYLKILQRKEILKNF